MSDSNICTWSQLDLIVWPCGTYCYRYELHEFNHKSDDYEVIKTTDPRYESFFLSPQEGL